MKRVAPRCARSVVSTILAAASAVGLAGCAITSSHDNVAGTADLVARQTSASFSWQRDAAAAAQSRQAVQQLLADGITAQESVAIAFLASPDLQLALDKQEVSRSDLIAASTFPNPVAIVGVREPGGNLAVFYPERNLSVGLLQNVLGILNTPARRRVATRELERSRFETAERIVGLAADVNQAYLEHITALRIAGVRRRSADAARLGVEAMRTDGQGGVTYSTLDIALERNNQFATEGAAARADLDVATTRARLAQLMGINGLADDWRAVDDLAGLPASDPALPALEAAAITQRLDILAAKKATEARLSAVATQKRWRWLGGLELGVFRESASGGTDFTGPNALVEVPLFDQRQAQIAAGDAEASAAMRTTESLVQAARADLRIHAAELATTRALVEKYRDLVLPNHQAISAQLDASRSETSLDRMRVVLARLGAEEEYLGLLRDYWRARSALARSAGDWATLIGWPAGTSRAIQNGARRVAPAQ